MGRDNLELAENSLFIKKTGHAFTAADADLMTAECAYSKASASGVYSAPFQAAALLLGQDADAVTIAGILVAPLMWQGLTDPDEVGKYFSRTAGATLEDLKFPFWSRIHNPNCK